MVILWQCYATRATAHCDPFSVHASIAECRTIAQDYQRFDRRALLRTGIPLVVSYRCQAGGEKPHQD